VGKCGHGTSSNQIPLKRASSLLSRKRTQTV
jgi:hypothetical protein